MWQNRLIKKGKVDSPVVEMTPFVFNERLYLLENWRRMWDYPIPLNDYPKSLTDKHLTEDIARIRDIKTDKLITNAMVGYGFVSAYVWDGRVFVIGGKFPGDLVKWSIKDLYITSSCDLKIWTQPEKIISASPNEHFFNTALCHNGDKFILLVETDDPAWPKFTFKFYESSDLQNFTLIENALYGVDKYVGGPAMYFTDGFYYVLYLQELSSGWETRITRSRDLVDWEDAPEDRAVVKFDPDNDAHLLRGPGVKENNASDAEACQWEGKTLVYFTGGDQLIAGCMQWAEFDGPLSEFLAHYFD